MTDTKKDDVLGFILLDEASFDFSGLKDQIMEDWNAHPELKTEESDPLTCTLTWDTNTFAISLMAFPVPDRGAQTAAAKSLLADEAAERSAKEHKGFLTLVAFHGDEKEKIKTRVQFTKIACSLLALPSASALFMGGNGSILSAEMCRREMKVMKAAEEHNDFYLPSSIWVSVQFARQEKSLLFYTEGLHDLGKKELIFHTQSDPQTSFQLLKQIIFIIIQHDVELEDGPLSFSEEVQLLVKTDTDSQSGRAETHLFLM